jgi:hypothetical protein
MAVNEFPGPPQLTHSPDEGELVRWARQISAWGQRMMAGRSNNIGEITLTANGASITSVTDFRVNVNSALVFVPTTQQAHDIYFSLGGVRATSVANGSFSITHADNPDTTATFKYVILG